MICGDYWSSPHQSHIHFALITLSYCKLSGLRWFMFFIHSHQTHVLHVRTAAIHIPIIRIFLAGLFRILFLCVKFSFNSFCLFLHYMYVHVQRRAVNLLAMRDSSLNVFQLFKNSLQVYFIRLICNCTHCFMAWSIVKS